MKASHVRIHGAWVQIPALLSSYVSWGKWLNLSVKKALHSSYTQTMLTIVVPHVVVARIEFANLYIKHLEPCLAPSKRSESLVVISVIYIIYACEGRCLKENKWNPAPLLGRRWLKPKAWSGMVATGYWEHADVVKTQGAAAWLGRQFCGRVLLCSPILRRLEGFPGLGPSENRTLPALVCQQFFFMIGILSFSRPRAMFACNRIKHLNTRHCF